METDLWWYDIWHELRSWVIEKARERTKDEELQKDCIQEAWLYIWDTGPNMTMEFYRDIARRAIKACYDREWRYKKKVKNLAKYGGYRATSIVEGD